MIYIAIQSAIYTLILYSMIGFDWKVDKFLWFFYYTFMCFVYFILYGMMLVALTPGYQFAAITMTFFINLWNLFSGFVLPRTVCFLKLYQLVQISAGEVKFWLISKCFAANTYMVEVVLLGFTPFLDTIWHNNLSGRWQKWSNCYSRDDTKAIYKGVPKGNFWFRAWLPWICCLGSHSICACFLLCLRIWHQVPQFPEKMISSRTDRSNWYFFHLSL